MQRVPWASNGPNHLRLCADPQDTVDGMPTHEMFVHSPDIPDEEKMNAGGYWQVLLYPVV